MEIVILLIVHLVLVVAVGFIAASRGRSVVGWVLLQLIFPIAILFLLISPPERRSSVSSPSSAGRFSQPPPPSPTQQISGRSPGTTLSFSVQTSTQAAPRGPAKEGRRAAEGLRWDILEKYDSDIEEALTTLSAHGPGAVQKFKEVYEVINDRCKIKKIVEKIIQECENINEEKSHLENILNIKLNNLSFQNIIDILNMEFELYSGGCILYKINGNRRVVEIIIENKNEDEIKSEFLIYARKNIPNFREIILGS